MLARQCLPQRQGSLGILKVDLNQRSRHGQGSYGDDEGQKSPIRGIFAVIRALKIGHRDTSFRGCAYDRSLNLNYILVYVARAPNHQNPDHEVKYQRQEDFHRIVSNPVFRQSRVA